MQLNLSFNPLKFISLFFLFLLGLLVIPVQSYVPANVKQQWQSNGFDASIQQSISTIETCALDGKNTLQEKELFYAVKFIDRYASQIYDTYEKREALLERTNGSWELRLALNSDKDESFYPHPEFRAFAKAFSTVTPTYFGKGISTRDDGFCFVALAGPSTRNVSTRQVFMNYEDYFISGQQVPGWDLSYYIRGYQRNNGDKAERQRPKLAFTVVCATERALVVRGSKTGGMAIFRRMESDMSLVAFGN